MARKFTANIASYILSKLESTASNIQMNGTRSAGISENMARADHIHPSDTSKVDSSEFVTFSDSVDTALSGKASSTHTHGYISNDGKIGTAAEKIITTTTGGKLQASNSITKSKISDFPTSMTPTSHAATSTTYGGGTASNYGHVKLSDSYTSSDGAASASVGASSKAVSDSYGTLSTIKENKYGFWYGNSSSNEPTWALHNREDPLKIKQNTPIKIFVYTMTPNGHINICDLGESVQYLFAKIVINDTIYTQYMDTTTKTINMPISWSPGTSGNMTIHVFWGEWSIGSDIIRFTVVDNYS